MEPVARRTRRRRKEALLHQLQERKKAKPSSDRASEAIAVHNLVSSGSSSSSSSSSEDSDSASSLPSVYSNRSLTEEHEEEEDVTVYVPKNQVPQAVTSSSSESDEEVSDSSDHTGSYHTEEEEEEDVTIYVPEKRASHAVKSSTLESEEDDSDSSDHAGSDYNEEEGDDEASDIEAEYKDSALGSKYNPIVLGPDNDDDDEEVDEDDASVSSRSSMNDSEGENRCTINTNNVVVDHHDDDDSEEEEEEEEEDEDEEEVVVRKDKVKVRQTKRPLTATEFQRVLVNSIMEQDVDEQAVKTPHDSKESSCSSDVDSGEEIKIKDPQQQEIDDCYKEMNTYLENGIDFAAGTWLADEDNAKNQEMLCKEGKHYLIMDEQIGMYCKLCPYIEVEIKHVLPPFHDNPFAVSGGKDECYMHDYRGPKNPLYFEDPNIEAQHFKVGDEFDTTGTVWELKQGLRDSLLPQQREAFEFIWRNVCGGTNLDELMKKTTREGGGCLISHAPGTGKTRIAIAFLETYMKLCKKSRPVVLAPASILLSWKEEFLKWRVEVPFVNLNEDELSDKEISFACSLPSRICMRNLDVKAKRLIKLLFWKKHETVLAVSYNLFPMLVDQDERLRNMLTETPGVLVLDEAHMPRNEKSQMFKVLKKMKTKKRILLSGTPFQNNFRELRNILCLVRKEFKEEIDPFRKSVDESDEAKIKDLKDKMKPFCHCSGNHVLVATLPGLVVNNVDLQPSEHQKRLLKYEEEERKNYLEANVNMTLISVHPMLLHCKESKTDVIQELKNGKWEVSDSNKARFLIRLIQLSSALEERVLVFSEYRDPLTFIKGILQSHHFGWREGIEIHLMNGSQEMETRKRTMDLFNKPDGEAKVMLASTRACSEGIQLTGASRVVFLDLSWNPSVDTQAHSRAFRMCQQKVVHVYRLIMTGNDSSRCWTQNQKSSYSKYMLNSDHGPQTTMPGFKDIILERLLEENIIKKFTQV